MPSDENVLIVAGVGSTGTSDNTGEELGEVRDVGVKRDAVNRRILRMVEADSGGRLVVPPSCVDVRAIKADRDVLLVGVRIVVVYSGSRNVGLRTI